MHSLFAPNCRLAQFVLALFCIPRKHHSLKPFIVTKVFILPTTNQQASEEEHVQKLCIYTAHRRHVPHLYSTKQLLVKRSVIECIFMFCSIFEHASLMFNMPSFTFSSLGLNFNVDVILGNVGVQ